MKQHSQYLMEDLAAAEAELHYLGESSKGQSNTADHNQTLLQAKTVLYVGGRPGSSPPFRDYIHRNGESSCTTMVVWRTVKGLLDRLAAAGQPLVVFPVIAWTTTLLPS